MNAILLTGTIDTSVFSNVSVVITDKAVRKEQYEKAIERYIRDSLFDKIVFAENSGAEFNWKYFEELAQKFNKEFEYLYIPTSAEKTIRYGKSYGEAVLIEQGILKSRLLVSEKVIYKCTGRVYVKNINKLIKRNGKGQNEFIAYNNIRYCFTLFFKVRREDFLKALLNAAEECDERTGKSIEYVYYERLIANNISSIPFKRYPDFEGVCGTDGNSYGCGRLRLFVKNILIKTGEYSVNPHRGVIMDAFFRRLHMGPQYEEKK